MQARLYTIPGSHPGFAARLMLEHKGIPFKRTDLLPVVSKGVVRAAGSRAHTVPAVKIDGKRTQGSRQIARELDLIQPDPPLFPADPEKRAAVEEAERFGDEDLQHPVRQIIWWALRRDMSPLVGFSEGAKLGIPINSVTVKSSAPLVVLAARINGSTDVAVRRALAELPGLLDTVDASIAAGTIDGERAERRRLPDRPVGAAGDDDGRPAAGDRGPARRQAREARRPPLPRRRPADPAR